MLTTMSRWRWEDSNLRVAHLVSNIQDNHRFQIVSITYPNR